MSNTKNLKVSKHYKIAFLDDNGTESSTLAKDGYSKYHERLDMKYNLLLNRDGPKLELDELVYGLEQAIEHVSEYVSTNDEYSENRKSQLKNNRIKIKEIIEVSNYYDVV